MTLSIKYTCMLPRWERLATNWRVLGDALSRKNGLKVPTEDNDITKMSET
ncbi:hypothetical protein PVK06_043048 [Gossypium arboreum]|uniref:Uncharacterized protein n=1 Tax=Gossypium arboreum TaxID=29729 RepID=A0ABR0MMG9_GOSAR|nr:hypothetical protein PVK06_043048 [Gossypium arboreum]